MSIKIGYLVNDFDNETQNIIRRINIDKNKNGHIETGEELNRLLSATGKSSIGDFSEREVSYPPEIPTAIATAVTSAGVFMIKNIGKSINPINDKNHKLASLLSNLTRKALTSRLVTYIGAAFGISTLVTLGIAMIDPQRTVNKPVKWEFVDVKEDTNSFRTRI